MVWTGTEVATLTPEPEAKRKRCHVTVYDVILHFEKTLEGLVLNSL